MTGVLSCCVWVCSDVLINKWRRETSGCLNSRLGWWWEVGAVVHSGLLRVDAQAEKNERHGESRVKTGAATSEESQRCMSLFSRRGPRGRGGVG